MHHTQNFSKKTRLLTKKEFDFVFQNPKKIKQSGINLFSRYNKLTFPRIGLSISKKYIKNSHERNRIKRYMRETFRKNQNNLLPNDFVFTIHSTEIQYFGNHLLIKILQNLWYHYFFYR